MYKQFKLNGSYIEVEIEFDDVFGDENISQVIFRTPVCKYSLRNMEDESCANAFIKGTYYDNCTHTKISENRDYLIIYSEPEDDRSYGVTFEFYLPMDIAIKVHEMLVEAYFRCIGESDIDDSDIEGVAPTEVIYYDSDTSE